MLIVYALESLSVGNECQMFGPTLNLISHVSYAIIECTDLKLSLIGGCLMLGFDMA